MVMNKNVFLPLAAASLLLASVAAQATHGNGGLPVSYNGSLNPAAVQNGSLTGEYDWYCFAGTAGTEASVTVTRTTGDLLPNLELWAGTVADGTPFPYEGLTNQSATNTSNDIQSAITVNYTLPSSPNGNYSVVVSTWLGETGTYSIALTGGQATTCGASASVVVPVPTLSHWGLLLLVGLVGLVAAPGLRRRLAA